ncbi:MAG: efflux RND transporter periplasmic adaptor subunit [Clostridiales Family XIII bacterium]|jgi:multidrug resistance efflux pump|nr:efflux RND transporter periplasmic adaptor subunit [Clostridiales Family XIII bacterium]
MSAIKTLSAIIAILAAMLASGCSPAAEAPLVTVEAAGRASASGSTYLGSVEAGTAINLSPDISGKVASVEAAMGDIVKSGDLLFTLDTTDFSLQYEQAEAAYRTALASYENSRALLNDQSSVIPSRVAYDEAIRNYMNLELLFAEGAVSQSELDAAKARRDTAEAQWKAAAAQAKGSSEIAAAQLDSAKAALEIAQQRLDSCTVSSPIDAEVLSVDIKPGDMISPQASAVTLIDVSKIIVRINVTESRIGQLYVGKPAEIRLPATGAAMPGTVKGIAPGLDPATGMFAVEIGAANNEGKAGAGMTADVRFEGMEGTGQASAPPSAIRADEGGSFVYIAVPDAGAAGSAGDPAGSAGGSQADPSAGQAGGSQANPSAGPGGPAGGKATAATIEKRYLNESAANIGVGELVVTQSTADLREGMQVSYIIVSGQG